MMKKGYVDMNYGKGEGAGEMGYLENFERSGLCPSFNTLVQNVV